MADDPVLLLRDGFQMRESVAAWLAEASSRLTFTIEGNKLVVQPAAALTNDDTAMLREHAVKILQAVRYCEGLAAKDLDL